MLNIQPIFPLIFPPLLGQPAIEELQLLARVGFVQEHRRPEKQFPKLYEGLGKLSGEYTSS